MHSEAPNAANTACLHFKMKAEHRMTCPECGNSYYERELPRDCIIERCPFRVGETQDEFFEHVRKAVRDGETGRRRKPEVRDSFEVPDDENVRPTFGAR